MGRRIQYDHSVVTGLKFEENGKMKYMTRDDFIHQRHQDPVLMACKRSRNMASCDRFEVETTPAFSRWVDEYVVQFASTRAAAAPEYEW